MKKEKQKKNSLKIAMVIQFKSPNLHIFVQKVLPEKDAKLKTKYFKLTKAI